MGLNITIAPSALGSWRGVSTELAGLLVADEVPCDLNFLTTVTGIVGVVGALYMYSEYSP